MTIRNRMNHSVDINNPTWSEGARVNHWTTGIDALITWIEHTVRTPDGDFVSSSALVLLPSGTTVGMDSEVRINGETDVHPVVARHNARGSRSDTVKHVEVHLG